MTAPIGSQLKRDLAYVFASFLERNRRYTHHEIESLIRQNVRPSILERRGLAPDHIRRAMIENGYALRDASTNETWIADSFEAAQDIHNKVVRELERLAVDTPEVRRVCPSCGKNFMAKTLFTHYVHKHARPERWETIMEKYFGWE